MAVRRLLLVVVGFGLTAGALQFLTTSSRTVVAADPVPTGPAPFAHWPMDQKPDAVIVLSGQTYGYLSPCGCSRPQKGGLERRANFMDSLRAKGWPVVGLDLGDVSAPRKLPEQELLKYKTTMLALKSMGYAAVGVGDYDVNHGLFNLLGEYTLQNPKDPRPVVLAANLAAKGTPVVLREQHFAAGPGVRPMVEDVEVVTKDPNGGPCLPIGVVGTIGLTVQKKVLATDAQFEMLDNGDVLNAALAKLAANSVKPEVNVLLYAGTLKEAEGVAKAFPAFNVILCQIEEQGSPLFPTLANDGKTFIIQVGHKGQSVGVVGVFKTPAGIELKYQIVDLGEQYLTPKERMKDHKVLALLENYTQQVKDRDLLGKAVAKPIDHPAMIQNPNAKLQYIGADKCVACHPNEGKVWGGSHHSHAYDSLVTKAANPGQRQFDADCVSCHSTGFGITSGFQSAEKTPELKHNGCENCHGPGSGHAKSPSDKAMKAAMLAWRQEPGDKMPAKATLEALAKVQPGQPAPVQLTPREKMVWNQVNTMCMRCHDGENDPKFDLNLYFPKIWHGGFKAQAAAGLPINAK